MNEFLMLFRFHPHYAPERRAGQSDVQDSGLMMKREEPRQSGTAIPGLNRKNGLARSSRNQSR